MDTNIEAGFVPNRGNCMVRDQVLYQQRQLYGYTGTNQVPIEETEWIYFTGTRFQQRKLIGTRTLFQTEEAIRTGSDIVPIEETLWHSNWLCPNRGSYQNGKWWIPNNTIDATYIYVIYKSTLNYNHMLPPET